MMGRRIREHLQVVGRVLVVGGDEEGHHPVEELLAGGVVREQRVPVDVVQGAVLRQRCPTTLTYRGQIVFLAYDRSSVADP